MDLPLFSGEHLFMDSWAKMDLGKKKKLEMPRVKAFIWVIKSIRIILECVFIKC